MAVISAANSQLHNQAHACVICTREMPLDQLTAGLVGADGVQRYACYGHMWDGNKFILGWALFAIEQRQIMMQNSMKLEYERNPLHGRHLR
jgi:hypothetical protein